MTKALVKHEHHVAVHKAVSANRDIMMIALMAGLVSALLPSVPTILVYWNSTQEVNFFGLKLPYNKFLKYWLIASGLSLALLYWKFRNSGRQHGKA